MARGGEAADRGSRQVSTASLVTRKGCVMQVGVKRFVAGGFGASWGFGMCFWVALLGQAVYIVVPELWLAFLSEVEQVVQPSSTGTSTMT